MIAQLVEFSHRHLGLVLALVLTTSILLVVECVWWFFGSRSISPIRLSLMMSQGNAQLLDLRTEFDFIKEHIPTATHIIRVQWVKLLEHIIPTQPVILITEQYKPAWNDIKRLRALGITELYHLQGGIEAWERANLPIVYSN